MLNAGEYVKNILNQRNMTQMDLVRKINSIYGKNVINKQHLNNYLNGIGSYNGETYPKLIEKALDLPEGLLIKLNKGE